MVAIFAVEFDLLVESGQFVEDFVLVALVDFLEVSDGVALVLGYGVVTLRPNMPQSEQMGS